MIAINRKRIIVICHLLGIIFVIPSIMSILYYLFNFSEPKLPNGLVVFLAFGMYLGLLIICILMKFLSESKVNTFLRCIYLLAWMWNIFSLFLMVYKKTYGGY